MFDYFSDEGAIVFGILLAMLIVIFGIAIPFLITLRNCLKVISPQNRRMEPGLVWLLLIPAVNFVWQFIVVARLSESIESEYRMRGVANESQPTQALGMAWCILGLCAYIPLVGSLAILAALICWIIYWVRIAEYKNRIKALPLYVGDENSVF